MKIIRPIFKIGFIGSFFLSLIFTGVVFAQNFRTTQVQRPLSRVQALQMKNQGERAKILQEKMRNCAGKECEAIANFSLGYRHAALAKTDPAASEAHLSKAAAYYSAVLKDFPKNTQALGNLAIVEQQRGNWDRSIELFKKARAIEPDKSYDYFLAMGDVYKVQGDPGKALAEYRRAVDTEPRREEGQQRIMAVYRQDPNAGFDDIFSHALELQLLGKNQLGRQAMELAIRKSYKGEQSGARAETALVYWADLCAQTGWISKAGLKNLPNTSQWPVRSLAELSLLLDDPVKALPKMKWWAEKDSLKVPNPYRSLRKDYTAARIMKTLADQMASRGDIREAARIYEDALRFISKTPSGKYFQTTSEAPAVFFDISTDLALLYHRSPKLDPNGKKLDDLILELFRGKGKAYRTNDREAIRRYHTSLGIIYAERGIWESDWAPANAIFQLENALINSPPDEKNPYLSQLLGNGYARIGNNDRAVSELLESTKGYLDRDQLKSAGKVLETTKKIFAKSGNRTSANTRSAFDGYDRILRARRLIDQLPASAFDENSPQYFGKRDELRWLFDPKILNLSRDHIQRQTYKAVADLAKQADSVGHPLSAKRLFTRALSDAEKVNLFMSMEDLSRMESIQNTILKTVDLEDNSARVRFSTGNAANLSKSRRAWQMVLPQKSRDFNISVGSDFLLAGKIIAKTTEKIDKSKTLPKLSIKNGDVRIYKTPATEIDRRIIQNELKTITGIRIIEEAPKPLIKPPPRKVPIPGNLKFK